MVHLAPYYLNSRWLCGFFFLNGCDWTNVVLLCFAVWWWRGLPPFIWNTNIFEGKICKDLLLPGINQMRPSPSNCLQLKCVPEVYTAVKTLVLLRAELSSCRKPHNGSELLLMSACLGSCPQNAFQMLLMNLISPTSSSPVKSETGSLPCTPRGIELEDRWVCGWQCTQGLMSGGWQLHSAVTMRTVCRCFFVMLLMQIGHNYFLPRSSRVF